MGAGNSNLVTVLILTSAILYLAWRLGRVQQELLGIRADVDAAVSLNEVEEQLLPALDSLEQETARLKTDLCAMKRNTEKMRKDLSNRVRDDPNTPSTEEVFAREATSPSSDFLSNMDMSAEIPLLVRSFLSEGLGGLNAVAVGAGVPTTKVVISPPSIYARNECADIMMHLDTPLCCVEEETGTGGEDDL